MKEKSRKRSQPTLAPVVNLASGDLAVMSLDPLDRKCLQVPLLFGRCFSYLSGLLKWAQSRRKAQNRRRKLRVCESAQLGDKRFVALVQADGQRFLIGGTANSIALLATLPNRRNFRSMLPSDASWEAQEK